MNDAVIAVHKLETWQYAHEMHEHDVLHAIAEIETCAAMNIYDVNTAAGSYMILSAIERQTVANDKWRSAVNLMANGCWPISISERELNHLNAAIKFVPASAKLTGHR
jgi:hypothetical protein